MSSIFRNIKTGEVVNLDTMGPDELPYFVLNERREDWEKIELDKELDRDKFANDFEEEHGWCPDAGYEDIKK